MHLYIVRLPGETGKKIRGCTFYQEALQVQTANPHAIITDHNGAAVLPGKRNPLVEQLAAWLVEHTRIQTDCHEVAYKLVVFLAQARWRLPELGEDADYISCTMLSGWLRSHLANKDTPMADIAESLCQVLCANDWQIPEFQTVS